MSNNLTPSYLNFNKISVSDVDYDSDSMKKPRVNEAYLQPSDKINSHKNVKSPGELFCSLEKTFILACGNPKSHLKLKRRPLRDVNCNFFSCCFERKVHFVCTHRNREMGQV